MYLEFKAQVQIDNQGWWRVDIWTKRDKVEDETLQEYEADPWNDPFGISSDSTEGLLTGTPAEQAQRVLGDYISDLFNSQER